MFPSFCPLSSSSCFLILLPLPLFFTNKMQIGNIPLFTFCLKMMLVVWRWVLAWWLVVSQIATTVVPFKMFPLFISPPSIILQSLFLSTPRSVPRFHFLRLGRFYFYFIILFLLLLFFTIIFIHQLMPA
uniref:Uncharacterized protein n=1 Tax=Cacopsylla melanoneura TaxID=428564 RepID=A0A8D8ZBX7_9HEMI